jgi:hypothetical protein
VAEIDRVVEGDDVSLFDAMLAMPAGEQSRAAAIIARRGRAYKSRRGMVTLQVFSTAKSDVEAVCKAYGGNYYSHSSGYQWSCSRRDALRGVAKDVLPIAHGGTHPRLAPLFALVLVERLSSGMDGERTEALAAA